MQKLSSAFIAAISSFIALTLMYPQAGYALGLGKLSVESNLGQPLRLEIQLDSVTEVEAETLDVTLASRSDFSRAGVEYPPIAGLLNFELVQTPDGGYVVVITTEDALQETYLHLLVSALWSGGKAVREYTALLDPPLYSGKPASDVTVAGQEEDQAAQEASDAGVETAAADSAPVDGSGDAFGEVLVRKGDTLSQIVNDISKPANVDYFQALEAVYRNNPEAFINNNMNLLRAGVTLKIPSFEEMQAVSRRESIASFTAQLEKFNAYRESIRKKQEEDSSETMDQLIEESVAEAEQQTPEVDTAAEIADSQPAAAEIAETEEQPELSQETAQEVEEVVEEATLTIGQQIGEGVVDSDEDNAAELEALRAQLAQLDESLLASGVENESVRDNLRQIQNQVERISTLIEVEDTGLAMAQNRAAELDADTASEMQAEEVEMAQTPEASAEEEAMAQIEEAIAEADQSAATTEETTGVDPEASVEEEVSNEAELAEIAQQQTETESVAQSDVAETAAVTEQQGTETQAVEQEPQQEESEEVAQLAAAEQVQPPSAEESDTGDQGVVGAATRQVAKSGLLDSIKGMFSGLPEYGLKIAAGLLALLGGLFLWQRRKSRKEFDASMLDIETEEVSMNSETTIKKMSDASGIDLASTNDSALELTIGGGMSYLSEEGITGVNEEENEVIKAGAVDPLAEADVYLAYDRDEQAIQVLKEAFGDDPERGELAEKLLEIYHKQDDRRSFDALATELHRRQDSTQNLSWEKVISMGKEVSPDNPLYSGEAPAVADTSTSIDLEEELLEGLQPPAEKQQAVKEGAISMDEGELDLDLDVMKPATEVAAAETIDMPEIKEEVNELEIEDLDIDFEKPEEEDKEVAGIDAPTLSQIISENAESELNLGKESMVEIRDSDLDEISLNGGELELDLGKDTDKQFNQIEEEANRAVAEISQDAGEEKQSALDSIDQQSGMSEMSQLEPYHESETALELAKAYLELGEQEIAKGFIEEVLNEGSEKQKGKARKLIKELAS